MRTYLALGIFGVLAIAVRPGLSLAVDDKPWVIISGLSHSAPDTAYARLYVQGTPGYLGLEDRAFDGVGLEINPRDAEYPNEAFWQGQIDSLRSSGNDYLADVYEAPRANGSLSFGGRGWSDRPNLHRAVESEQPLHACDHCPSCG